MHGPWQALDEAVIPELSRLVCRHSPQATIGLPSSQMERQRATGSGAPEHSIEHFAWIAYEPEYARYGGLAGIALAEEFFFLSSEVVGSLLTRRKLVRSQRLGQAMLGMLVLIHAFAVTPAKAGALAGSYASGYLRQIADQEPERNAWQDTFDGGFERQADLLRVYVHDAWTRLVQGEDLTPELDRYRERLAGCRRRFDHLCERGLLERAGSPCVDHDAMVAAIVPSYLHMHNNRMGITVAEEAYLANVIRRAIDPPEQPRDPSDVPVVPRTSIAHV